MQSKLVDLRDIPTAESLIKKAIGMAENAEPRPTRLLLHARHQLGREFVRKDKASEALPMLLHVAGKSYCLVSYGSSLLLVCFRRHKHGVCNSTDSYRGMDWKPLLRSVLRDCQRAAERAGASEVRLLGTLVLFARMICFIEKCNALLGRRLLRSCWSCVSCRMHPPKPAHRHCTRCLACSTTGRFQGPASQAGAPL